MPLEPSEVDIFVGLQGQQEPEHAGPFGRITSLVNGQVTNYVPPSPGVNQKQTIKQRNRFEALARDLISPYSGEISSGTWTKPRLLATLGDQPVSVDGGIPRVFNGQAWTNYSDNRIITNRLEQSIFHTPNHTVQAPDSAVDPVSGVQCVVWSESPAAGIYTTLCGFKAANGAWIRTPFQMASDTTAMQRVCFDGTNFWVTCVGVAVNTILVSAFNVNGVFIDNLEITRNWATAPGWWDCEARNHTSSSVLYKAILAQPGPPPGTGEEFGVVVNLLRVFSGAVATVQLTLSGAHCNGPLAFLTNDLNTLSYLATAGPKTGAGDQLRVYEITNGAPTHTYTSGANTYVPDAITGYVIAGSGGALVGVCISQLSQTTQSIGPAHDPALRCVQVWETTRADVVTFIKQKNMVVLQSRAFAIDGDYYAYTYYQSGGGISGAVAGVEIATSITDYMYGEAVQPITVKTGDYTMGAASRTVDQMTVNSSEGTGSISHNAGDSVDGATGIWTLLNATFNQFMELSYLTISGSSIANNNSSYRVIKFIDATHIQTEVINLGGHYVTSESLTGVTAQVRPSALFHVAANDLARWRIVPLGMEPLFVGASIVVTNHASAPVFNGTYTVTAVTRGEINNRFLEPDPLNPGSLRHQVMGLCLTGFPEPGGTATGQGAVTQLLPGEALVTPLNSAHFRFQTRFFDDSSIGSSVVLENAIDDDEHDGNNGSFLVNDTDAGALESSSGSLLPELFRTFPVSGTPEFKASLQLASANDAFKFVLANGAFNDSYRLALLKVEDAYNTVNNGTYQIIQVVNSTTVIAKPTGSRTGQVNQMLGLADAEATITVFRADNTNPAIQPCWVMTPLRSCAQTTVGRFEYGIAYADWRFDGDANPNLFFGALSTPTEGPDGKLNVVLPYRAQSFTAGQIAVVQNEAFSTNGVLQTTVGIKNFTLRCTEIADSLIAGQPVSNSGELILPGPQGSQFTASGFTEDGINFAFEQPWLVSQATDTSIPVGLTPKKKYQYIIVAEVTLEDGDRVYSIPSAPLDVELTGTNNKVTLGGRLNLQTNHRTLAISIYRTGVIQDVETVEHYKITNDLGVNGVGFTFSIAGLGPNFDTWTFADTVPDVSMTSNEQLYTDKGVLAHYPAPAFHQGIGSAFGRTWVLGYDGAVWMSAEKTEGDAVWFHPNWRYTLPTDDKPVCLGLLDDYIVVFCAKSIWYIPKTNFPNATNTDGNMPTPVQLPFSCGATGFAVSIPGAVAYSSTAGGVWSITRNLTNIWLSEPVKDSLPQATQVRGLCVDKAQRLYVANGNTRMFVYDNTSGGWWIWNLPTSSQLISTVGEACAYQDDAGAIFVQQATPGADVNDTVQTGGAIDITFANISLAGIRRFSHLWALQFVGHWRGPHTLYVSLGYPDEPDQPTTEFSQEFLTDPGKYIYEINPMVEETSTFSLRIYAGFGANVTPGNTFELELLCAQIGVEKGLNRMGENQRMPAK